MDREVVRTFSLDADCDFLLTDRRLLWFDGQRHVPATAEQASRLLWRLFDTGALSLRRNSD